MLSRKNYFIKVDDFQLLPVLVVLWYENCFRLNFHKISLSGILEAR